MNIHLFGAATPTGEAFQLQLRDIAHDFSVVPYSRNNPALPYADFGDPQAFRPGGEPGSPGVWISFGPIWMLAPFLEQLALNHSDSLLGLQGLIACSSSSVITKRFASNYFDRELVARLNKAENQLKSICECLGIPCCILRPTLIYGHVGNYTDKNISRLISLMRRLPLLPLPSYTGLRQPIHASQLAGVVIMLLRKLIATGGNPFSQQCIALGGDVELTYAAMLLALQHSLPPKDPARNCQLLPIPTSLFQAAAAPLLFQSPKVFEAVQRISADLSGFTRVHQIMNSQPQNFPVLPLI